jgi:hypothetical protein
MGALPRSTPRNGSRNVGATTDGKKATANNQQEIGASASRNGRIGFPSTAEAEEWDHRRGRGIGVLPRSTARNGSRNVGATTAGKKATANNQQETGASASRNGRTSASLASPRPRNGITAEADKWGHCQDRGRGMGART